MKRREISERGGGSRADVSRIQDLIERIQDEDRLRLLEPTSLPKILRGRPPRRRPNTALLSDIALAAFKARMYRQGIDLTDAEAARIFRGAQ